MQEILALSLSFFVIISSLIFLLIYIAMPGKLIISGIMKNNASDIFAGAIFAPALDIKVQLMHYYYVEDAINALYC